MSKIVYDKTVQCHQPRAETLAILPRSLSNQAADIKDQFVPNVSAEPQEKPAPLFKIPRQAPWSEFEEKYFNEASKKTAPQKTEIPSIKSPTHTFNHTHEFIIKDGFLWYRVLGTKDFKPLFFDGFPHAAPIFIDADGANLIVVDNDHQLHYKKILEEFRSHEIVDEAHQQALVNAGAKSNEHPYVAFDVCDENNWVQNWFSLPVASNVVNIFHKSRLIMPEGYRAVAVSQRGRYNDYVHDCLGQHHPVGTGVTTVYVLNRNGQDIEKFDPWSPPWAKTSIGLKETHSTSFVAHSISVSASTIMALGYEYNYLTRGYQLMVLTMLADIDTIGSNPGIKYSFLKDPSQKNTRILPIDADWTEHPLMLEGQAMVTGRLTIRQTGEGNHARELRILGKNQQGAWGFWRKMIDDKAWTFRQDTPPEYPEQGLMPTPPLTTQPSVHDYQGIYNGIPMELINFGLRSNHAKLYLTIGPHRHAIDIYKRFGMSTFVGRESYTYDMVLNSNDSTIENIFGPHKTFEIRVKEHGDNVTIRSPLLTLHPFKFVFHKRRAEESLRLT